MNYIEILQTQNRALEAERATLANGLVELSQYLSSSKFFHGDSLDGYVQVNDVIRRLAETSIAASDAWLEVAGPILKRKS